MSFASQGNLGLAVVANTDLINRTKIGEVSDLDAEGKTRWDQASLSNENLLYEAQVKTGRTDQTVCLQTSSLQPFRKQS